VINKGTINVERREVNREAINPRPREGTIYVDSRGRYRDVVTGRYAKPSGLSDLTTGTLQSMVRSRYLDSESRYRAGTVLQKRAFELKQEQDYDKAMDVLRASQNRYSLAEYDRLQAMGDNARIGGGKTREELDFFWQLQIDRAIDIARDIAEQHKVSEEELALFAVRYVAATGVIIYEEKELSTSAMELEVALNNMAQEMKKKGRG